jgi:hypothetical protein
MKRLVSLAKWVGFVLILLPIFTKKITAQQGPPPVIDSVYTALGLKIPVGEYRPPPIYDQWLHEVAACHNIPVPPIHTKTQWFEVESYSFIGQHIIWLSLAAADGEANQVYVGTPHIWNESIIKHEQTHLLLSWIGYPFWYEHEARFFDVCGIKQGGP